MDFGSRQDILTNGSAVILIARMNKKGTHYEKEKKESLAGDNCYADII